ncbi:MAG: hypothetical protein FWH12_07825 [Treponema sp.]|nr:hypothetical protein [Treponema sp.]
MGFFTVGNIITLGIVLLILVLYRQMDRNSRNLKVLRDYSEKLKKDIALFMEEQEKAVKDYGISLKVERDSARELMKRLQMTEEELSQKAELLGKIDSQIKAYEGSLGQLRQETSKVQENMSRVREESSFVETTARRITDTKNRLKELEKNLLDIENHFQRENSESLEKTSELMVASVKSAISDLAVTAETIERKVEDHRQEINQIEANRAANVSRDLEQVNSLLQTAIMEAGKRADKIEDAAFAKLKDQAEERLMRIKASEEEKLKAYQESAKARVAEAQDLVKAFREEWRTERHDWESKDKVLRDERKKDMAELQSQIAESEKLMDHLAERSRNLVSSQEALLLEAAEEMKQKALEASGTKLNEYRETQEAELQRLMGIYDDAAKLDQELRKNLEDLAGRQKDELLRYEREAEELRKAEAEKFSLTAASLQNALGGIENDLEALKSSARENVSVQLRLFEDEFLSGLSRRQADIDRHILEWREGLELRLAKLGEESEEKRLELERSLGEEIRQRLSSQDLRLVTELEHLKNEAAALEENVRGQLEAADDAVASYKEQLVSGLQEARNEADISISSELGKHSLTVAEAIKSYQRDLETQLREMSDYVESRNLELSDLVEASRTHLEEVQGDLTAKVRELDNTIEDVRRRLRDLSADTDNRISSVRASVEDTERHIREAVNQTKLLDKADALRLDMERRIEDLKGDMDRLDQRKAEAVQLENEFIKIRRLEDDVNAKMTRFLSEKRRIEAMEADFSRLLQISRSVEEKLNQVSASDDTLQGVQLQIRKLEEALEAAEDRYQRMERKSEILEHTNEGIDRNFRTLQESEKIINKIEGELERFAEDLSFVKTSIEKLAGESEKAREAADRMDALDNTLEEIEERIQSMQRARQWIADAETRLEELNKDAQIQARAIETVVKGKKTAPPGESGGTLSSQQKKENIIALARMGWKDDEIAKNLKISLSEVELTREMAPRD